MINSTADRVTALCRALERKGFSDQSLEIATTFSELNELVDREFPFTTSHLLAIFQGDERVFKQREDYRKEFYEFYDRHFKQYESILT